MGGPGDKKKLTDNQLEQKRLKEQSEQQRQIGEALKTDKAHKTEKKQKIDPGEIKENKTEKIRPLIDQAKAYKTTAKDADRRQKGDSTGRDNWNNFVKHIPEIILHNTSEKLGFTVMVADMAHHVFSTIGECHDKNSKATIMEGIKVGLMTINGDNLSTKNKHMKGELYDKKGFSERVKKEQNQFLSKGETFLRVENTTDYDKQIERGIDIAREGINATLKANKDKSPEIRQAASRGYVDRTIEILKKQQQQLQNTE